VMILVVRFSSWVLFTTGRVDPHISLVEDRAREIAERQRQQQISAFVAVTEGEVFRTEERIREATALATAASLFAARESLNSHVLKSVTDLLVGIKNEELMPPGLQLIASEGTVSSSHAKLTIRYRQEPLGIEVLSLGKVRLDGPALLVRVPGDGANREGAVLFVATSLEQETIPTPFANEAEIFARGFVSQPLRGTKSPKQ